MSKFYQWSLIGVLLVGGCAAVAFFVLVSSKPSTWIPPDATKSTNKVEGDWWDWCHQSAAGSLLFRRFASNRTYLEISQGGSCSSGTRILPEGALTAAFAFNFGDMSQVANKDASSSPIPYAGEEFFVLLDRGDEPKYCPIALDRQYMLFLRTQLLIWSEKFYSTPWERAAASELAKRITGILESDQPAKLLKLRRSGTTATITRDATVCGGVMLSEGN